MFNIFKKKVNPQYVINAHGVSHVSYTEKEMWNILAQVGYDAEVIKVN